MALSEEVSVSWLDDDPGPLKNHTGHQSQTPLDHRHDDHPESHQTVTDA